MFISNKLCNGTLTSVGNLYIYCTNLKSALATAPTLRNKLLDDIRSVITLSFLGKN